MPFRHLSRPFTVSIHRLKRANLAFSLVFAGILCLSCVLPAQGFIVLKHAWDHHPEWHHLLDGLLIEKVHAPHWTIHYTFQGCGEVDKETQERYEQIVTKFIQSWLQPLREYTNRPIVNDFRYKLSTDWHAPDFSIISRCDPQHSYATFKPLQIMHKTRDINLTWRRMASIIHELGHLFGLADTYLSIQFEGDPRFDTGGPDGTKGSQPSSIMSGLVAGGLGISWDDLIPLEGLVPLGLDDRNGILWLYKHTYEGLALKDCFFPNYQLEESPFLGCAPTYPLIFVLHQPYTERATEISVRFVLEQDEGINVNAQDRHGMTALHYAVSRELTQVIKMLLKRPDIKPFLRDKQGHTALKLARERGLDKIESLLLSHPLTLPVNAKDKLTTTWGRLKQQD